MNEELSMLFLAIFPLHFAYKNVLASTKKLLGKDMIIGSG